MRTAKTDQTGQMPRLILVYSARTCSFVGFVMRQLMLWTCFSTCINSALAFQVFRRIQQQAGFIEFSMQNFDEARELLKNGQVDIREV